MRVTCNACGAVHQVAPPPWVVDAGRPFRMVCASCGAAQEVIPIGLAVLDDPVLVHADASAEPGLEVVPDAPAPEPSLAMPAPSTGPEAPAPEPPLVMPAPSAGPAPSASPEAPEPSLAMPAPSAGPAAPEAPAPESPLAMPAPSAGPEAAPAAPEPSLAMPAPSAGPEAPAPTAPEPAPGPPAPPPVAPAPLPSPAPPPPLIAPVEPPAPADPPPPAGGRFVLRLDGELFEVDDLATLQRWVDEGRVEPGDELSECGGSWHRAEHRADLRFAPAAPAASPLDDGPALGLDALRHLDVGPEAPGLPDGHLVAAGDPGAAPEDVPSPAPRRATTWAGPVVAALALVGAAAWLLPGFGAPSPGGDDDPSSPAAVASVATAALGVLDGGPAEAPAPPTPAPQVASDPAPKPAAAARPPPPRAPDRPAPAPASPAPDRPAPAPAAPDRPAPTPDRPAPTSAAPPPPPAREAAGSPSPSPRPPAEPAATADPIPPPAQAEADPWGTTEAPPSPPERPDEDDPARSGGAASAGGDASAPVEPAPLPDDPVALVGQGWAALDTQDVAGAVAAFERALALQPNDVGANYGLGYALLQRGRLTQARPLLCRAHARASGVDLGEIDALLSQHGLSCR